MPTPPTRKQAGLFSDTIVDVPEPEKSPRLGKLDSEILQTGMEKYNPSNPFTMIGAFASIAKDVATRTDDLPKITDSANALRKSNTQGLLNTISSISGDASKRIDSANRTLSTAPISNTPIKSAQDRIKEIEARQASQTPNQRNASILAASNRIGQGIESTLKQGEDISKSNAEYMVKRATSGTVGDVDTALQMSKIARQHGFYVNPEIEQAKRQRSIIAVDQGSLGPPRLQDLESGDGRLMTNREVATAGDRLNAQMDRERKALQAVRDRSKTGTPLFRECVDYYKNVLID